MDARFVPAKNGSTRSRNACSQRRARRQQRRQRRRARRRQEALLTRRAPPLRLARPRRSPPSIAWSCSATSSTTRAHLTAPRRRPFHRPRPARQPHQAQRRRARPSAQGARTWPRSSRPEAALHTREQPDRRRHPLPTRPSSNWHYSRSATRILSSCVSDPRAMRRHHNPSTASPLRTCACYPGRTHPEDGARPNDVVRTAHLPTRQPRSGEFIAGTPRTSILERRWMTSHGPSSPPHGASSAPPSTRPGRTLPSRTRQQGARTILI